jgi:glutaredoxin 3
MNLLRSLSLMAVSASAFVTPPSTTTATNSAVTRVGGMIFSRSSSSTSSSRCASSSAKGLFATMSATDFVKSEIEKHKVVVFSKTYCPYCTSTKDLFEQIKVNAVIHELDTMDNGADIQAALLDMTGQRTVPSVFINQKHLGGNDKTQDAYRSGKLEKLLNA